MYFRTSDKMKISDKLAIRREVGGGGGGNCHRNLMNHLQVRQNNAARPILDFPAPLSFKKWRYRNNTIITRARPLGVDECSFNLAS